MSNKLDEYEWEAKAQLARIHREYMAAAEPYLKILETIHSLRPPRHIYLDIDHARYLQASGDLKNSLSDPPPNGTTGQ